MSLCASPNPLILLFYSTHCQVLQTQRRVLGPEHKDTLSTAMQLAGASLNAGRNADAEAQYREILAVQTRVLGVTDPATLTCQMNLASSLLSQARYKEAEELYKSNLEAKTRRLGCDHVDTLMVEMNLVCVAHAIPYHHCHC